MKDWVVTIALPAAALVVGFVLGYVKGYYDGLRSARESKLQFEPRARAKWDGWS